MEPETEKNIWRVYCLAIREAFQALDVDADGLISIDDVRTLLHLFNPDMDDTDTQMIVNEASSYGKSHSNNNTVCDMFHNKLFAQLS